MGTHPRGCSSRLVVVGCIALLGACAAPPETLLHRAHREYYALQPAELERARYFVSERIVAHELVDGSAATLPSQVLVIEPETPGVVTAAGPDWLRVAFDRGPGVLFIARFEATADSWYQLASDPEPGQRPRRVRDSADSIARVGDRRYKVIFGAEARLMIDADALREMLETRPRARGREPD
jgi:hypothetical protein